jgi:hypothetical protein
MSLGNKLTGYVLLGVPMVTGLDVYFSLTRTRAHSLDDLRREVAARRRTLWVPASPRDTRRVCSGGAVSSGHNATDAAPKSQLSPLPSAPPVAIAYVFAGEAMVRALLSLSLRGMPNEP